MVAIFLLLLLLLFLEAVVAEIVALEVAVFILFY